MSTTLLLGFQPRPVPVEEAVVRSTVTVVEQDEPSSVATAPPDFNELFADPDTAGGLTSHQVAPAVIRSERFVPNIGDSNAEHNVIVDRQVSTSGTAAARELTGTWGHGTMKVTSAIEPTMRDGGFLGGDYFIGHPRPDASMDSYMSPSQQVDPMTAATTQATGEENSRAATRAAMYDAFLRATSGAVL